MEASFQFPLGFKPVGKIVAVPADRMSAKTLLLRESADRGQCKQQPAVPSSQARHIVRAQQETQRRERLVDPIGEADGSGKSTRRDKRPRNGVGRAHGFGCSCAVPVVQGRDVTHGK